MKIRCDVGSVQASFKTTEKIPATLAALREYMQKHAGDKPFSEDELHSLRFRHRTYQQQEGDLRVEGVDNWKAPWYVLYVKDEHRSEGDRVAAMTKKKASYRQTIFGMCEQYPIG
jgi:hypothetical protein